MLDNTTYKYTLIIFVRNFFCGNSQHYLRHLIPSLLTKAADSGPDNGSILSKHKTRLLIIGHGHPTLIPVFLKELPELPPGAAVSTDPAKGVFSAASLGRTWYAGAHKPDFMEVSALGNGLRMTGRIIKHAAKGKVMGAFNGGDYAQNGGEFLVKNTEDAEVLWGHRMRNTRDHTKVDDLVEKIKEFAI
jgi:hypothetical protein